jgi:8-oxo-dGTP pyrophosphatase MutT (NUDIX family)
MTIRQVSSRVVYRNRWMIVREDEIERDNGARGIYGVVEKPDGAIVIALDGDSLYLVEQYRYALGVKSIEFPQGSLERSDVDPAEIARQELREETGLAAERWEYLGEIYIACGYANQKTHAFLATGLTRTGGMPDAEEHDLAVRKVKIAKFERLLRDNVIKDAQTLAAWGLYLTRSAASREIA